MNFNRREFLFGIGALSLGGLATASYKSLKNYRSKGIDTLIYTAKDQTGGLYLIIDNPFQNKIKKIKIQIRKPHSAILNPKILNHIIILPRVKKYAALVDIHENRQIKAIQAHKDYFFYGHARFSEDHKYLFSAETGADRHGHIVVRDAADYKVLDEFPSYGYVPHDFHFLKDGKTIVIANNGVIAEAISSYDFESSLTYVDINSTKLLEKEIIGEYPGLNIQHLSMNSHGDAAIALDFTSQSKNFKNDPPLIAYRKRGEKIQLMDIPQEICTSMRRNTLSICHSDEKHLICATNPHGRAIVCDFQTMKFVKDLNIEKSTGVTLANDSNHFLVTNSAGIVHKVSLDNLEVIQKIQHKELSIFTHTTKIHTKELSI